MSINKPGPLPTQPSIAAAPSAAGPETIAPPAGTKPGLRTHQSEPNEGWYSLPDDVLGRLMGTLVEEVLSPDLTPDERSHALGALFDIGGASSRERRILSGLLGGEEINRQKLRDAVTEARRSRWIEVADYLESNPDRLRNDFSATRKLITAAEKAGDAITLPKDREGISFRFRDIEFSPAIAKLMSELKGKTVKLDASGIGRDRFIREILPALEKISSECHVVLDASSNDLISDHLEELVRLMAKKHNIYRLDLSRNPLTAGASGAGQILKLFTHAGPMTHLYLVETGFDTSTAALLENGTRATTMLQQIDLRDNQLDEAGVISLFHAVFPTTDDSGLWCPGLRLLRFGGNPCATTDELIRAEWQMMMRRSEMSQPMGPLPEERQGDPNSLAGMVLGGAPSEFALATELPTEEEGFAGGIRAQIIADMAELGRL